MSQDKITIRPGYAVVDCSSATGGVHHYRTARQEAHEGQGKREDWSTTKTVDHTQVVKESEALVKRVDYLMRTHATRTGFGWYADDAARLKINNGLVDIKAKADALNEVAVRLGSARRTHVNVLFLQLDVANEDVAKEIFRIARANLMDVHACLRDGRVEGDLHQAMIKAKNVGNVASGILRTVLAEAMNAVPAWRNDVRAGIKKDMKPEVAGAALNLDPLDAAIQLLDTEFNA